MAITVTTNTPVAGLPLSNYPFAKNATSADASGCEEIIAAVTAKSIYIQKVTISTSANITVTLGAGETTGTVTTVLVGPVAFAAAGGQFTYEFAMPIMVAAATALVVDASGAGDICVYVEGVIG